MQFVRPTFHSVVVRQFGVAPQEIAQRVVLCVPPWFKKFFKGFTVKSDMRAFHLILGQLLVFENVFKTVAMVLEITKQRRKRAAGRGLVTANIMGMRNMNVIPDPDILIARKVARFG